jgi:hypothetical protein
MGDINQEFRTQPVQIFDEITGLPLTIELDNGKPTLKTTSTVESLRGFDPIADTWLFIGTEADSQGVGGSGDTVQVEIAAGDDAVLFPAVDVTTTVQLNDTEDDLADRIASDLNADADFTLRYSARRVNKRATMVYITSKELGPQGERPNQDDFQVTTTGTTIVTRGFDNIVRRNKVVQFARSTEDPTSGVLGISGSVTAVSGDISGRFIEFALDGASNDMTVDGSITPVEFLIDADANNEKFVESLRFEIVGNGIQFTNFFSKNGPLTNGLMVTIRSNNSEFNIDELKTTEDFASNFALGPDNFDLFIQSGADVARATLTFQSPIQLFKQGTFIGNDDFIKITIRDDLSSGVTLMNCRAFGFLREF